MGKPSESRTASRKWLRGLAALILGSVGFAGLLCLLLLLGLQSASVRSAILEWAGSALEKSTGIHLTARDFDLSVRAGQINLEGLELRGGGRDSDPFLVVPEAKADVSWRSLLSDRPQIHEIHLREPVVDLGGPVPQATGSGDAKSDTLFPSVDIHHLRIVEGSIVSVQASEDLDEWFDRWQAERITIVASLIEGRASVEIQSTKLLIESHRRPPIAANLTAVLSADEDRDVVVDELALVGDGLELRAEGSGRLEAGAAIDLSLDLESDLATLVPDLTTGGRIEVGGRMTFNPKPATLIGEVRVSGRDLPAELLEPLLASAVQKGLKIEGTHLDLEADLDARIVLEELNIDPGSDLVRGEAVLTWRRQEEPLVIASVETLEPEVAEDAEAVTVALGVRILPEAPGSRSLSGQVRLPAWHDLGELELQDVNLEIRQDDLASLAETLGLTADALWGFHPSGSLTLVAEANGPLVSPDLDLEGSWRLEDQRLAEVSAHASSMKELLFSGELLPDAPGRRRVAGRWSFAGLEGLREGSFDTLELQIDLPEIESSLARFEDLFEVFWPDPRHRERILEALTPELRDRLTGTLQARLEGRGSWRSPLVELTGKWVPADSEFLSVEASYDGDLLTVTELSGVLEGLIPGDRALRFRANGEVGVKRPIRQASLDLQIFDLIEEIGQLDVGARLEGGTLILKGSASGIRGNLEATVPLALVHHFLPRSEALADLPLVFDSRPLELEISGLDLGRTSEIGFLVGGLDMADLEITGVLDTLLALDPTNPLRAIGTIEVGGLDVRYREIRLRSESDLRIDLAEGQVALQTARLQLSGPRSEAPMDLMLTAELDPEWRIGSEFTSLIDDIDVEMKGTVDSSVLTPFLAGGVATGPVSIAAIVQGSIDNLEAEVRVDGPDSSLVLPGKYRTRISEPELEIVYGPSGLELRESRVRLNRGEVIVRAARDEEQILSLGVEFEGVRYRLDYGLTVSLDGNLDLVWPPEGRRRLTGKVEVERGSLRRDIQLERELIRMLNAGDLAGGGSALQESIDLDIELVTREGVRLKNNVADLRADWDLIRVRGTLANPTLAGSIDIDPGGLLNAYGQTVRIDQGSLVFSGVSGEPPRMDFETTTSAEDPRLRSQWDSVWSPGSADEGPGGGFWDRYDPQSGANAFQADEFTSGLTSYFQNRFLQSITGGAPIVELSVQPLPLMGETDTTARVTMSYQLTPQISYVLSQNPREAEGRTDILNLQNLAVAPSLRAQVFRNDEANQGVTLQQMLEFGGGRRAEDALPRLGSIALTAPEGMGKRKVRRATGLRKGQPVAEGADFDIEIDMLDALARKGFPAADVNVEVEPAPRNRVAVGIAVEPGPRVDFEFTGDRPHRRARQDIMALYQPTGMDDSPALETVRRDAVRALRGRGFLDPQFEVTTEYEVPGDPAGNRVIRVHGDGGRQVNPQTLEFQGVPEDVEMSLVGLFSSRLSRVELAMGEAVADQLFEQSMSTVGFSESQILSRELSDDGLTLSVEVEPGPRRHLAQVQILGIEPDLQAELDGIRELQPGDPVRTGQIARTAYLMEDRLREKGFAESAVRTRVEPTTKGKDGEFDLFFDVEVGREHRIGEIEAKGLANSSPAWVKQISRLETGDLLTASGITEARRRLARTGIFQRIAIQRQEPADPEAVSVFTPITFELEEHPRYRVTYGVRAESTREAGVVADVSDLNFLGRGQTLGLRLIYSTLERNARLYWSIPRVRQTNKNLEFFLEARREEQPSVDVGSEVPEDAMNGSGDEVSVVADIQEAWAQLTFPWGRRSVHRLYTVYKRSQTEDRSKPDSPAVTVVSPFSGWQVSYDTGERSFFETSTDRVTVFLGSDLSFSSESLGSDYTGYGWFGQLKPQIPLVKTGDSAVVWVHNYRTGLKKARDDSELPFFDRLFAGGEFSVRGYPTNSLGPISESGIPIGGEAMFVTNQELRFPIWSLISGVVFFDAGNVWATLDDVESTLFKSVGAGLRADSPIGPLRLDLAFPLDRREGDPEYKIYFGLGQTF